MGNMKKCITLTCRNCKSKFEIDVHELLKTTIDEKLKPISYDCECPSCCHSNTVYFKDLPKGIFIDVKI